MATDATGTPSTNFSFPKYNTAADAPSGVGLNAIVDDVDSKLGLVTTLLGAIARISVRKNSAGSVFSRRRINLIEGTGVTLTVADDSGNEEVDITIAASVGSEVAYKTVATDTTFTTEATLITFDAFVFEAVKYYLEVAIPILRSSITSGQCLFRLEDDGSGALIGTEMAADVQNDAGGLGASYFVRMPFTPGAGSATYRVTGQQVSAATYTLRTTSFTPATFRIVKA